MTANELTAVGLVMAVAVAAAAAAVLFVWLDERAENKTTADPWVPGAERTGSAQRAGLHAQGSSNAQPINANQEKENTP